MLEVFEDVEEFENEETEDELFEFGIDFTTGQLSGEIVSGIEALKVWIYFALRIQRYRFRAFTWNYGFEGENLIGKNYGKDYTESEIKRLVNECVEVHPKILDTEDFKIAFEDSSLSISFKILTSYGDGDFSAELETL